MTTNVNLGFVAAAAGTVNAITATYSPAPTALVDKMLVWFRATGANTSTTPTFSPNGLTARTIVKQGGTALVAGDIPAANAIMEMVYDASNTRWELVNPAHVQGYKVYRALLTQTGTDAPVVTVLENTLGGNLTSVYNNAGNYSLTSSGLFTLNKTLTFIGSANDEDYAAQSIIASIRAKDVNEIVIDTVGVDASPGDGSLTKTAIQIFVYY